MDAVATLRWNHPAAPQWLKSCTWTHSISVYLYFGTSIFPTLMFTKACPFDNFCKDNFQLHSIHWLLLRVFLQPSFCCRGSLHCRAQQDRRRLFVFSDLTTRQRTKLIWRCFFKLVLLCLWDLFIFCPSSDTLIGSNVLLYSHQLKLRNCTEADKNLYINKGVESKHCKVHFLPFWSGWKGPSTLGCSS